MKPLSFSSPLLLSGLLFSALLAVALSSCSTSRDIKPGHALLEIKNDRETSSRIRSPKFVSVNGTSLSSSKQSLPLPPGRQKVKLQFSFPGTKTLSANLDFKARANQRYAVKFDVFPPNSRTVNDFGDDFRALASAGEGGGYFLFPWMVYSSGKWAVKAGARSARQISKKVKWAYIDVISSDLTEGIVQRVRVP